MSAQWLLVVKVAGGFLLVFLTGFWLARLGKPYGTGLLTVHKLLAVGILVFLGVSAYRAYKMSVLGAPIWFIAVIAVVAFVAMIASGGVLSAAESPPALFALLHKVTPYAAALFTAVAVYYLPGIAG